VGICHARQVAGTGGASLRLGMASEGGIGRPANQYDDHGGSGHVASSGSSSLPGASAAARLGAGLLRLPEASRSANSTRPETSRDQYPERSPCCSRKQPRDGVRVKIWVNARYACHIPPHGLRRERKPSLRNSPVFTTRALDIVSVHDAQCEAVENVALSPRRLF
jgi:hypothetical protein